MAVTSVNVSDCNMNLGNLLFSKEENFFKFLKSNRNIKSLDLGYEYKKLKEGYKSSEPELCLEDMIYVNWAHSADEGLESLGIAYRMYISNMLEDKEWGRQMLEIDNREIPKQKEEPKKEQPQKKEEKKEVEKAAASDSIANGIKNMQKKNVENQKPNSGKDDDVPQRVTFNTFDGQQQNAATFNKPTFKNEHDLMMFEMGRRQAMGQAAQQMVMDQYGNVNTGYYTPTVNTTDENGQTVQVPATADVPFSYNIDKKNQEVKQEKKEENKIPFCKYIINEKTQAGEVIKEHDPNLWKLIIKLLKNKKTIERIYKDTGVSDLKFDLISKEADQMFTLRTNVLGRFMDVHYNDGKLWTIWLC